MNGLQKFMSANVDNDEDVIIDTMLNNDGFHHLSRFNLFRHKMEPRPIDDEIEFGIPSGIHQLNQSTFSQKLPKVVLNDEFKADHRIAWVPKTLLRIIESAQMMKSDGSEIGSRLNDRILDIWVEYFTKEFYQNEYESLLDMIQGQTEWSNELSEKILSLPQPFFYATANSYFKRCLVERQNISHRYRCRMDIRNLLMLEQQVDGVWKRCPPEDILTKCRFSNLTADGNLFNQPELWGTCIITNEREYKDTMEITLTQNYLNHAQEFVYVKVDKILEGEGTESIRLEQSGCVRGIYWVIENLNATQRGDYFNYATEEGDDPVIRTSMYHLDRHIWTIDSHHHRLVFPAEAKLRTPRKMGYHYHPMSVNGSLKNTDTNVNLLALQGRLDVKYNMGSRTRGRLHIFLDMHRIVSYENGDIKVLRDEGPIIQTPAVPPTQQPSVNNRPAVALPQRHR